MEKEFVPYELALRMKQLGFDEPCFGYWYTEQEEYKKIDIQLATIDFLEGEEDYILAPIFPQAFGWFREKYFIHGEPKYKGGLTKETAWYDYIIISNIDWDDSKIKNKQYKTYEEAELACLEKLIEIVENNLVD
jgi:hypothetical protein